MKPVLHFLKGSTPAGPTMHQEEASAKYQVVNLIHDVIPSTFEPGYTETKRGLTTDYGYNLFTSYGSMLGKTEAEILVFITTNKGAIHRFPVMEYWQNSTTGYITKISRPNNRPAQNNLAQEGAYQ